MSMPRDVQQETGTHGAPTVDLSSAVQAAYGVGERSGVVASKASLPQMLDMSHGDPLALSDGYGKSATSKTETGQARLASNVDYSHWGDDPLLKANSKPSPLFDPKHPDRPTAAFKEEYKHWGDDPLLKANSKPSPLFDPKHPDRPTAAFKEEYKHWGDDPTLPSTGHSQKKSQ